ncbi:hypothetical protein BH10PLA1_BH10PLA1_02680 [soil metagenome]
MAILPTGLARVSNLLRTNVVSQSVSSIQEQLLQVQNELATGRRLNSPSDNPGDSAVAQQLRKALEAQKSYSANLTAAQTQLSTVDSTTNDLNNLLLQAQTIASQNVGSDVTPDARKAAAAVVDSIYNQALTIANKQSNGVYLFAGDKSGKAPYVETNGGVKFVGSTALLSNLVDDHTSSTFNVDGTSIFGAVSSQVQGTADLTPTVSSITRLGDLRGATNDGVSLSSIVIGNGATSAQIDLGDAQSLGDVVNTINAAAVPGVTASISADGHSVTLTPSGSETISVTDVANGTSARDLGILQNTPAAAGAPVAGTNLNASITPLTTLASLRDGTGIDTTSGFTITNGQTSATIDLSTATTVEDLLNKINGSNTGVLAEINAAGTGINILNPTQGTDLRISDNGGTTASDLGLRSLTASTPLADLNGGKGVGTAAGNDLTITRIDGTTFGVDIDGAVTVQDVINKINAADAGGGVTASFATTGNGIVLTDTSTGSGSPALSAANFSTAAKDLGLLAAPVGNTITATDTNPIRSDGIFSNLNKLRNALRSSDQGQITEAAEGLKTDFSRVTSVRGTNGAKLQEIQSRQSTLADQTLTTTGLLTNLEGADYTDTVTRYQTLQTALQASLRVGASQLNLSLMDFIT